MNRAFPLLSDLRIQWYLHDNSDDIDIESHDIRVYVICHDGRIHRVNYCIQDSSIVFILPGNTYSKQGWYDLKLTSIDSEGLHNTIWVRHAFRLEKDTQLYCINQNLLVLRHDINTGEDTSIEFNSLGLATEEDVNSMFQ